MMKEKLMLIEKREYLSIKVIDQMKTSLFFSLGRLDFLVFFVLK